MEVTKDHNTMDLVQRLADALHQRALEQQALPGVTVGRPIVVGHFFSQEFPVKTVVDAFIAQHVHAELETKGWSNISWRIEDVPQEQNPKCTRAKLFVELR